MKLLKTIFILLFIFQLIPSHAQYFEGKLTYEITYDYKSKEDSIENAEDAKSIKMDYYIKNGNYKSVVYLSNGKVNTYTYSPSENRIYNENNSNKYVNWKDCSYSTDTLLNMTLSADTIMVNNYKCQKLDIHTTDGRSTFYVTHQLKIDPRTFEGHEMAFWHKKLEKTNGALNVKFKSEHEDYFKIRTLTKVEEKSLSDNVWKINKSKIILPHYREHTSAPEVKGGLPSFYRCLIKKIKYPNNARRLGIEGKVLVQFLVNEDGSVSELKILQGVYPEIDEETLERFEKCEKKWTPAYIEEKPVKALMVLPFTFKLD